MVKASYILFIILSLNLFVFFPIGETQASSVNYDDTSSEFTVYGDLITNDTVNDLEDLAGDIVDNVIVEGFGALISAGQSLIDSGSGLLSSKSMPLLITIIILLGGSIALKKRGAT